MRERPKAAPALEGTGETGRLLRQALDYAEAYLDALPQRAVFPGAEALDALKGL